MPSEKPRLMLTLTPEVKASLEAFTAATGKPSATFISEILEQAVPLIEQLTEAALAAKGQRAEALDMLLRPLAQTQIEAGQLALKLHDARIRRAVKKRARLVAASNRKGPELIGEKPRVKRGG